MELVLNQLYLLPEDMQKANEYRFSRKFIDRYIRKEIRDNPEMEAKLEEGIRLVREWLCGNYHASKNQRLSQLQQLDLEQLVMDIFVGIAYFRQEELFTSVSAQMAGRLGFDDKRNSILTMAELLAVLCQTDAFDICKASRSSSLVVLSRIPLSDQLVEYVENSLYLPPMVCPPRPLKNNFSSGYLTHNDSLVLGKGNHHDGNLCLDVLNIQNAVALKLSIEFLCSVEEEPTYALLTQQQVDGWNTYKANGYKLYSLLAKQGNRFWLTHKVDKRGRIYAQGYHISTQGSSFKKASLELCNEELVEGVP